MYFLPRHKPPTRHSGTVHVLHSAVCVFVHVIAMGLATLTHTSKPSDYYYQIHLRAYNFFFPISSVASRNHGTSETRNS